MDGVESVGACIRGQMTMPAAARADEVSSPRFSLFLSWNPLYPPPSLHVHFFLEVYTRAACFAFALFLQDFFIVSPLSLFLSARRWILSPSLFTLGYFYPRCGRLRARSLAPRRPHNNPCENYCSRYRNPRRAAVNWATIVAGPYACLSALCSLACSLILFSSALRARARVPPLFLFCCLFLRRGLYRPRCGGEALIGARDMACARETSALLWFLSR